MGNSKVMNCSILKGPGQLRMKLNGVGVRESERAQLHRIYPSVDIKKGVKVSYILSKEREKVD